MQNETRPDQARVAENHREQPDDAPHARLIGELDNELRKIVKVWT
jgi:hypothetical protein